LALACKELQARDFYGRRLPGAILAVVLALSPTNITSVFELGLRKLHAEPVSQGTSGGIYASTDVKEFINAGVEIRRYLLYISVVLALYKRRADFKTRMIHSCIASAVFP